MKPVRVPESLDAGKLAELDRFIDELPSSEGVLIETLHKAQGIFGYLPHELQLYIARRLNIPGAEVYGVVSFYSFFTQEKPGEHAISVCMGTACFVRGADKIMDELKRRLGVEANETTPDRRFTLRDVRCVGACGLAPVVMVDDRVFGRVGEDDVGAIIEQYNKAAVGVK